MWVLFVNLTLTLALTGTILPSGAVSGSLVWDISPSFARLVGERQKAVACCG
jgi:hypothetical protein